MPEIGEVLKTYKPTPSVRVGSGDSYDPRLQIPNNPIGVMYDSYESMPGYVKPKVGPTPEEAERERAIRLGYNQAGDYERDIPMYEKRLSDIYEGSARKGLAQRLSDIKRGYARRGLLSSGMREGAEYKAMGETDVDLSAKKADIKSRLADNLLELQRKARNAELGEPMQNLGALSIQSMEANLRDEIAKSQAQQQLYAGLGQAIGKIGGAAAARFSSS